MKISFVIPAYNEESCIGACLDSILQAIEKEKADAEVIVVDNASTDATSDIVRRYEKVKLVCESKKGLVQARQAGYLAASGDLIANIDADNRLTEKWITKVLDEFAKDEKLIALSGPLIYYDVPFYVRFLTRFFYCLAYGSYFLNRFILRHSSMLQGGNFVIRKTALDKLGGYDTRLEFWGEDADIAHRLHPLGKVKLTFQLPIFSSGRRLMKEGIFKTGLKYTLNYYSIIFFKKPAHKKHEATRIKKQMNDKLHSFSIIIPARNEEHYIASCVRSLKDQGYAGEYEIIVVDNASTDRTAEVAEKAGAKVLMEKEKGVSQARRTGCAVATGEILALSDADSQAPPDWLTKLNDIFNSDEKIVAAGGLFRFSGVSFTVDLLANKIFLPFNAWILKKFISPRSAFLTGSNMAIRKTAYEKCGGFDPKYVYGEDNELAVRAMQCGKVFFDSTLFVKTSFRRYSGGHKNIFFVLPSALKEVFVTTYRFIILKSSGKVFEAQKPVREKNMWVSLTFDDGPYGKATEKILDILKEKNSPATFFTLGINAKKYPHILEREVREGHIVGLHSFDHSRFLFLRSKKTLLQNLSRNSDAIFSAIHRRPRFYRPAYGYRSPWMKRALFSANFKFIGLGIMTSDYNAQTKSQKIADYILRRLKPGSIITLHDGRDTQENYSRENVIAALPKIIDGIRSAGFEIVPLDQLTGEKTYF
jgi:glycosyltransferase involved in cell wall biosynthesis